MGPVNGHGREHFTGRFGQTQSKIREANRRCKPPGEKLEHWCSTTLQLTQPVRLEFQATPRRRLSASIGASRGCQSETRIRARCSSTATLASDPGMVGVGHGGKMLW